MSSMPHDVEYIKDNNFNGHFDLHFRNSTRHKDGMISQTHQAQTDSCRSVSYLSFTFYVNTEIKALTILMQKACN